MIDRFRVWMRDPMAFRNRWALVAYTFTAWMIGHHVHPNWLAWVVSMLLFLMLDHWVWWPRSLKRVLSHQAYLVETRSR